MVTLIATCLCSVHSVNVNLHWFGLVIMHPQTLCFHSFGMGSGLSNSPPTNPNIVATHRNIERTHTRINTHTHALHAPCQTCGAGLELGLGGGGRRGLICLERSPRLARHQQKLTPATCTCYCGSEPSRHGSL